MKCNRTGCLICSIVTGGIFFVTCLVLLIIWPNLYSGLLTDELTMTNVSKSYNMWKETPIPMYMEVYLYNFSNANEVMRDPENVKPYFTELGPYVFKEHHLKVNLTWNQNHTLTFLQRRTWKYLPERSNGSLSDSVTNINVVTAAIGYFARNFNPLINIAIDKALKFEKEHLLVTKTVDELLFKGYKDNVVDIVRKLNIPGLSIPFDKFGWFYGRNGSDTFDGVSTMYTGADDIKKLGILSSWNYRESVAAFTGECARVTGGAGEIFPPLYYPDNVTIFPTDICSGITLKHVSDTTFDGISGSLFVGDDRVFDNGWNHPESKCYCVDNKCAPFGTRDVSKCKLGVPAFVSFPHFYLANSSYLSKIDGIAPNRTNDEFQIGLEVFTGIPLYVKAQLQLNIHMTHIPGFSTFKQLPDDIYIPMLWFRQEVELTDDYRSQATLVLNISSIVPIVLYLILFLGFFTVVLSVAFTVKMYACPNESGVVLVEEEEEEDKLTS